jgi:hypothetical protein
MRRTGFLEHGQLYACGPGRRRMRWRLATTPSEEGSDGEDNHRVTSPQSSTHYLRSPLPLHCPILVPPTALLYPGTS